MLIQLTLCGLQSGAHATECPTAAPARTAVEVSIHLQLPWIGPAAFERRRIGGAHAPPAVEVERDQSGDDAGHGKDVPQGRFV